MVECCCRLLCYLLEGIMPKEKPLHYCPECFGICAANLDLFPGVETVAELEKLLDGEIISYSNDPYVSLLQLSTRSKADLLCRLHNSGRLKVNPNER